MTVKKANRGQNVFTEHRKWAVFSKKQFKDEPGSNHDAINIFRHDLKKIIYTGYSKIRTLHFLLGFLSQQFKYMYCFTRTV